MRKTLLLIAFTATAVLSSCRDAMEPDLGPSAGPIPSAWHLSADRTGDGHADSELHILEQSLSAPPLETYDTYFRVCRNKARTFRIRYAVLELDPFYAMADRERRGSETTDVFLELHIPRGSLERWPDGRPFGSSECVWVRVMVDRKGMVAEFSPAGIKFDTERPAQLRVWYKNANPDVNGDGVVDHRDQEIFDHEIGLWRLPHSDEPWYQIGAVHYRDAYRLEAELWQFSHYAVAH